MTITLYSAPGCGRCRMTAKWLQSHGLNYEERVFDVANHDEQRASRDQKDLRALANKFQATSFPIVVLTDGAKQKVVDYWGGSFNVLKLNQLA